MIGYDMDPTGGGLCPAPHGQEAQALLCITTPGELREGGGGLPHDRELLHGLGSARYCKAEQGRGGVMGTIRVPQKSGRRAQRLSFDFYLTEKTLYCIGDAGQLRQWVEKQAGHLHDLHTPDRLLLQLMGRLIEDDILYLSHVERELECLEEQLPRSVQRDFFLTLTGYRQKLSELNAYYEQLTAIGELMQLPACFPAVQSAPPWENFTKRCEQLQGYVHLLRENALQLRELSQALQSERQNKVMGVLTVVTTLFLPLTLLTGWYGMNFANMPELQWQYGYPAVIAASVLIVALEIIFFKKNRFF